MRDHEALLCCVCDHTFPESPAVCTPKPGALKNVPDFLAFALLTKTAVIAIIMKPWQLLL